MLDDLKYILIIEIYCLVGKTEKRILVFEVPKRLYASIAKIRAALAACASLTNQIVVFRQNASD